MQKTLFLALLPFLMHTYAVAEVTPRPGQLDPRVRVVDYAPGNVVRLITYYGVSTHVQFANGEVIRDVAVGDEKAWNIAPRGNNLFIKPKEIKADTNVTVITDKRIYHFALVVQPTSDSKNEKAWRDPNLIFSLSFRYPEDQVAKLQITANAAKAKADKLEINAKLAEAKRTSTNLDYWAAGSEDVKPTAVRDDGRFTYLTFTNNRDMPAVYSVDEAGQEALINTNVEGVNTIVVHRIVRKLILRKGSAVACVVNKAFDQQGIDNFSGTVAPDVERVIKGAEQ